MTRNRSTRGESGKCRSNPKKQKTADSNDEFEELEEIDGLENDVDCMEVEISSHEIEEELEASAIDSEDIAKEDLLMDSNSDIDGERKSLPVFFFAYGHTPSLWCGKS